MTATARILVSALLVLLPVRDSSSQSLTYSRGQSVAPAYEGWEQEADGTKYRLIGIGVADLETPERADPMDLIDVQAAKRAKAENAMDRLRDKFGNKSVETGYTFTPEPGHQRREKS